MLEWNLKEIYINDEEWEKDLKILKEKIQNVKQKIIIFCFTFLLFILKNDNIY